MDQMSYTRELDDFMKRLGDTSASVAERQAAAAQRLSQLGDRQKMLEWAMQQSDVAGDPAKLRAYAAEYQRNAAEINRIENFTIREERTKTDTARTLRERTDSFARRTQVETDSLARLGINAGGGESRSVQSIERQVGEMKGLLIAIRDKTGNMETIWR
jgi:hypothetical protein